MFSLTFNTWKADVRSRTERDQDPKILDVGWTEFTLPTAFNDLAVKSSVHLVVDENSLFNNPGMKRLVSTSCIDPHRSETHFCRS